METCAKCGNPIQFGELSYYQKDPTADIGKSYHSACGDPFGVKAAVAAERERFTAMTARDTYDMRLFVAWLQIHD